MVFSPEMSKRIRLYVNVNGAAIYGDVESVRYWLARGAEVNHPTHPGLPTPIFLARAWGDLEMVELFLEAGAYVGPPEAAILGKSEILRGYLDDGCPMEHPTKRPLIAMAASGGDLATIQLIVERGANLDYARKSGKQTPLAIAAANGHRDAALYLAEAGPSIGFLEAIMLGDTEKTAAFLDAGAGPNEPIDNLLPLSAAAMTGQVETARLLLDRGADLFGFVQHFREDGTPHRKVTALETGVFRHWGEIVLLFLDYGLPIDKPEKTDGLLLAQAMFSPALVRALLARGADPNGRSLSGMPALHALAHRRPVETTRLLLDAGAEVDAPDEHGRTALMHAIWAGKPDHIRLLLERGANPHLADDKGGAGLNWIDGWTWRRGLEIQALLLELGLDVNTQDNEGTTPLMRAARRGSDELIPLYLEHGADKNLRNAKGETAMDLAQRHPDVLALLAA